MPPAGFDPATRGRASAPPTPDVPRATEDVGRGRGTDEGAAGFAISKLSKPSQPPPSPSPSPPPPSRSARSPQPSPAEEVLAAAARTAGTAEPGCTAGALLTLGRDDVRRLRALASSSSTCVHLLRYAFVHPYQMESLNINQASIWQTKPSYQPTLNQPGPK